MLHHGRKSNVLTYQGPWPAGVALTLLYCSVQAGNTALHHAAVAGNLAAAKLLLTSGPRGLQTLNMVNNKGRTPLHVAAVFGRQQLLQTLLKLDNARVDAKDKVSLHLCLSHINIQWNSTSQQEEQQVASRFGPIAKGVISLY